MAFYWFRLVFSNKSTQHDFFVYIETKVNMSSRGEYVYDNPPVEDVVSVLFGGILNNYSMSVRWI